MRIGFNSSVVIPKSWKSSHSFGRCCTSGEMICFGAFKLGQCVRHDEGLQPGERLERHLLARSALSSSSMSMPPWCVKVIVGARNCVESLIEK